MRTAVTPDVKPLTRSGLPLLLMLALGACLGAGPDIPPRIEQCVSDESCAPGEVCFVDGCGDPGRDIAVEVTPNNRAGQHAQDFALAQLQATQDFRLVPATILLGNVERLGPEETSGNRISSPYSGEVSVRLFGESKVIPGLHRSFDLTQALVGGGFAMPAASGMYQGTITTVDPSIPPQPFSIELAPGTQSSLSVVLPATDQLGELRGQLFGTLLPLIGDTFLLEALPMPAGQAQTPLPPPPTPLAQPALTNAMAEFTLSMPREVLESGEPFLVRATPVQTIGQKPGRTFEVVPQLDTSLDLQIGPVGVPVVITGRVLDGTGKAVSSATVYVDAATQDGATARSPTVRTAVDGRFSVEVLPNSGANAIWVVPQARDAAGQASFFYAESVLPQDVGDLTLPWRTPTRVTVVSPDSLPANSALVVAEPIDSVEGLPIPTFRREEITSAEGTSVLWLEPGIYRVDVNPGAPLPRTSRLVAVGRTTASPGAQPLPQDVSTIRLSRGRTVTGQVLSADGERPLAGVMVRYFRVVELNRVNTHLLLAEATTDANGFYSVALPTR